MHTLVSDPEAVIVTAAGLTLRPETDQDEEFLYRLYASTRAQEMAVVEWSEQEKADFLQMQFKAQRMHYREHYRETRFDVIELDGEAVGRLYVARWPKEMIIIDIALLPQHRGRGLGGSLMRELLAEAEAEGKTVSLHVEPYNPAMRLYQRLGFQPLEVRGAYQHMEWRAAGSANP